MCGIVGMVASEPGSIDSQVLERMNASLRHRGPDEGGTYIGKHAALAMRRLAIIDRAGGHQPVHNEDKRIWGVFNGEIYNYRELRRELDAKGHKLETVGDSETLVHLYEDWGVDFVSRLRGMFACALWDESRQRAILVRDRIGMKPLYYTIHDGMLLFGSELKVFRQVPCLIRRINLKAIERYLQLSYVPGPETVYENVMELPPGHYAVFEKGNFSIHRYWSMSFRPSTPGIEVSLAEWEERFLSQFRDSVKSHLVSEVPLGAFLSGGIDSSAVVAIMAQESDRPIETFSIGYEGKDSFQDERKYARLVAQRYGTNHHEFVVRPDIKDLVPRLVSIFDQPFADSSAIPNYYVCEMTKRHVTVALSGLGGDEIGGGYERYLGAMLAEFYRRLPGARVKEWLGMLVRYVPDYWGYGPSISRVKRFLASANWNAAERYAGFMVGLSSDERRRLFITGSSDNSDYDWTENHIRTIFQSDQAETLLHYMLLADSKLYLPFDLLFLTDRVSMAHSLEVRVPFLDHPLVELMSTVPARLKIHRWEKKFLLKRALRHLLPPDILHRKKMGFSIPLAFWLRTDLAVWMQEVLSADEIKKIEYLNPIEIARYVREHIDGQTNHENVLWALINLVHWHNQESSSPA